MFFGNELLEIILIESYELVLAFAKFLFSVI